MNQVKNPNGKNSVAVCIATYNRPVGLGRLLESLRTQTFIHNEIPDWKIVVVDNDASAPNKDFIRELREGFPVPISYEVQPKRGIASARNLAVGLADNVDYIAFIDDDEVAEPHWLEELLTGIRTYQTDVVKGPVIPAFEVTPKEWITRGAFFEEERFLTGIEIEFAATNNVLVSQKWFHLFEGPFDERLNFIGGEDSLFFVKIRQKGAKLIWIDEAIVYEYNPPQRANLKWILKRNLRMGNTIVHVERMANEPVLKAFTRLVKSGRHLVGGILLLVPFGIFSGFAGFVKSLCMLSRGIGELLGLLGIRYEIYK